MAPRVANGSLRASDAEREEAVEFLRGHCLDGRIDQDELEERIEEAYSARTLGELEEVRRELPLPAAEPASAPVARYSRPIGKVRDPVVVGLLSFFTAFLYTIYWWYAVNRELRDLGRVARTTELGGSPATSLAAVTVGWAVVVPPIVSTVRTCQRIQAAQRLTDGRRELNAPIAVVLAFLLTPALPGYMQLELNRVWEDADQPE